MSKKIVNKPENVPMEGIETAHVIGYQDAGATSTAIMIKAMGEFVKENKIA